MTKRKSPEQLKRNRGRKPATSATSPTSTAADTVDAEFDPPSDQAAAAAPDAPADELAAAPADELAENDQAASGIWPELSGEQFTEKTATALGLQIALAGVISSHPVLTDANVPHLGAIAKRITGQLMEAAKRWDWSAAHALVVTFVVIPAVQERGATSATVELALRDVQRLAGLCESILTDPA